MCVRYKGEVSPFKMCPGGGPQGGLLTGVLFILQVNKAGSPCSIPRQNPRLTENPENDPAIRQRNVEPPPCHNQSKLHKKSFIDDLTLLEKISLANLEIKDRIIGPPTYHDRFHLTLPPQKSILQHQLIYLAEYPKEHSMVLNS